MLKEGRQLDSIFLLLLFFVCIDDKKMLLTKCTHDIAVSTTTYPTNNVKPPPSLLKPLSTSLSPLLFLRTVKTPATTSTKRTTITRSSVDGIKGLAVNCCSYYYLFAQLFAVIAGKKCRLKWKNNFFIYFSILNLMLQLCCGQLLINVQNQVSFLMQFYAFLLFNKNNFLINIFCSMIFFLPVLTRTRAKCYC